jgi:hypothetical protein
MLIKCTDYGFNIQYLKCQNYILYIIHKQMHIENVIKFYIL